MNQRERQKADSKRAIVASAAQLIRERGSGGTSVQAAMAGAGLTVGAFYAHFTDKSALLDDAFAVAMQSALALIDEASSSSDGTRPVQAALAQYLSQQHRDDPRHGCPLPAALGEGAAGSAATSPAVVAAGVTAMRDRLARLSGQTEQDTLALVALMVGGQIMARALRDHPLSEQILTACQTAGERLTDTTSTPDPRPA